MTDRPTDAEVEAARWWLERSKCSVSDDAHDYIAEWSGLPLGDADTRAREILEAVNDDD